MKKKIVRPLKEKLLDAITKVLKQNKSEFTTRIEKVVSKSIKRIVKKSEKQMMLASKSVR